MKAKALMVQGTASSVGKSVMVAALCRIFRQEGLRVAPFKAQNMALNSYVTRAGQEMGRAQVMQAEAAGLEPTVDMNPILLKPEADHRAQVIVRGHPIGSLTAREYQQQKGELWPMVLESLARLRRRYDLVIIEGAGSPAEVNLRETEIVNMRVARAAQAPVLLVGDIDRGGVFAALVGTLDLLLPEERALVRGLIINKFRGDISLLEPGVRFLEERTGVPVIGVVPYFTDIHLPEEDSVALEGRAQGTQTLAQDTLDLAVIRLPRISNFDDFDPFEQEAGVYLRYVARAEQLGQPDLVLLPGTKSTISDLTYLREIGLADQIVALGKAGTPVIGICGGYQMLGDCILDPDGVESEREKVQALGLLPVTTTFFPHKRTARVAAHVMGGPGMLEATQGMEVVGYEIHAGQTPSADCTPPFRILRRSGRRVNDPDGAVSPGGTVFGTYIHGLFDNTSFRRALLHWLARRKGVSLPSGTEPLAREAQYDRLAEHVRASLDLSQVYGIIGLKEKARG